ALFKGLVPYKDFFHLRGPLELYIPAGMMVFGGNSVSVLSLYFYVGTVFTLLMGVLIAKEVLQSRYILYLFVPVFIARTFPRVYYNYWGGFRYGFGLLTLWLLIKYLKERNSDWIFLAGVMATCGFLTSIEIGVCSVMGVLSALFVDRVLNVRQSQGGFTFFCWGAGLVAALFITYFVLIGAFVPYLQSTYAVLTQMTKVFDDGLAISYPKNSWEVLGGLLPTSPFFKFLTPVYLYIFLFGYLFNTWIRPSTEEKLKLDTSSQIEPIYSILIGIAVYGIVMYLSAFRKIENAQFEMALQPEKILLFFLIERAYFWLCSIKNEVDMKSKGFIILLFIGLFMSSIGYSIARFDHRFIAFKLAKGFVTGQDISEIVPFAGKLYRPLNIEKGKGMVVPVDQAEELEAMVQLISQKTKEDETVLMYPELAMYSVFADRPFFGKFPLATLSWFSEKEHRAFVEEFRQN
ncbi:hypothetical protein MNBD_BACTEROID05-562, partial [hydrothermal vent metagenome]